MNLYEAFEKNPIVDEAKKFPLSDKASIWLRPLTGETSRRALEALMEPYNIRLNNGGKLTEEENRKLNAEFYSSTIVKKWEGLTDREGKEIEFSPENAKALFLDPKLEEFFGLIIKMAAADDQFRTSRIEADAGN